MQTVQLDNLTQDMYFLHCNLPELILYSALAPWSARNLHTSRWNTVQ